MQFGFNADMAAAEMFSNTCAVYHQHLQSLTFGRKILQPVEARYYPAESKKASLDETMPSSFRPLANLPFLSKVLEIIANSQLIVYLHGHNLLPEFQSAYGIMALNRVSYTKRFILLLPLWKENYRFSANWLHSTQ